MNNENLPTSFPSKAAQKKMLDHISRQYSKLEGQVRKFILADPTHHSRKGERYEYLSDIYWNIPSYPHQVREKHYQWFTDTGIDANEVRGLVAAREFVKNTPIVKPVKAEKSQGKRTDRSAKYWGVCQICGKEHKVDIKTGLLAEHGYTVEYGYYQRSCVGSAQLPLNVSVDFLRKEYDKVAKDLENLASRKDDEIHHTYDVRTYSYAKREYIIKTVKVYVFQIRAELNSLISRWGPIIENWKPFPFREIKYDD